MDHDMQDLSVVLDLAPLWNIGITLAVAIMTAFAGRLGVRVNAYLKLKSDSLVRRYFDDILKRGIGLAQQEMQVVAAAHPSLQVRNQVIAKATAYAAARAPDAIKHFQLRPSDLDAMVNARLGDVPTPLPTARAVQLAAS